MIKLNDVRNLAQKSGDTIVIVYYLQADGRYGYTSYGNNRTECDNARRIADKVYEDIGLAFVEERA